MRILFLSVVFCLLTACGKKGPLIYPDMLVPAAPTAVLASQTGSAVRLQFVLPDKDLAGRRLADLAGVKINKRTSELSKEQLCNSCMADYTLFLTLYTDLLPDNVQRYGNRLLVIDGDVTAGKTHSYVVVPFTKGGVDGAESPQVSISPVQPVAPPTLIAESFPTEIRISLDSSPPLIGKFVGYNIYRFTQKALVPGLPINREPLMDKSYIDSGLERNVKYSYEARTVAKLESGSIVESQVSDAVEAMLKNDE